MIVGNWKMNTDLSEAQVLAGQISRQLEGIKHTDVVLCPPAPYIYPLYDYLNLPGVVPSASLEQIFAMQIAFQSAPGLDAEFRGMNVKPLWMPFTLAGGFNFCENKPIYTVADLKGRKQRWTGDIATFMSKSGVECVPLTFPDIYSAAQTGVIQGFGIQTYLLPIYKFGEVAKYFTDGVELAAGMSNGVFVNIDAFNALPPEIQKLAEDTGKEAGVQGVKIAADLRDVGVKYASEKMTVIHFPPEERAKLYTLGMAGLEDGWLADMKNRGLGDQAAQLAKWAHDKKAEIEKTVK